MKLKLSIFILFLIIISNSFAQNNENKYEQYQKVLNIDVKNDTLSSYIVFLKESLHNSIEYNDTFKIAENNYFLALIYYQLNTPDVAIKYNLDAVKFFEQQNDSTYTIYALTSLVRIYTYLKEDSIALIYGEKVLSLAELLKDTLAIERTYVNIAAAYMSFDESESIKKLKKAEEIAKTINDTIALIVIYNNFGYNNFTNNNFNKARFFYNKSLSYIKDKNNNNYTASVYANFATLAYEQKDYKEAYLYAKTAVKYSDNLTVFSDIENAYQILIKAAIKTSVYTDAIVYFDQYLNEIQEDIATRKAEETARLKILYETDKLESKITMLKTENELKESKLAATKLKLLFLTIISILIVAIFIYMIFHHKKLEKTYKKIVEENIRSLKIEDENIKLKKFIVKEKKANISEIINDSQDITSEEDKLFYKIKDVIEEKELYKDPKLSLNKLSDELNTNRTYISRAINNKCNKSFVEFINEYRVNEAKRLLNSKEAKILSIEALGNNAGFNSQSTFFRVFKSITGVTPSFFMKNTQFRL